ncbi:hypothetical protein KO488_01910 [Poseidonibacter lekithochrous]|uniref:hypothetical protein n=1 Tax=Poseidonibacter TaxID=2321187 RepID=UPI001C08AEF1|nr:MULTISPECIES: hypothetical protein [Poseidonibacter]MBU3013496.1 hypothetical protein [Poseidonibacter lekithochrous]MDO6826793.1 hypothetical protein [Poseidonibacter sp. 1_MG-2023]
MTKIYYLDDEALFHLDSTKRTNSLLWKAMYKRVKKNLNTKLINPLTLKEIIFNKHMNEHIVYNSPMPNVMIQKGSNWYLDDNDKEYYLPISLSFSNDKVRFDLVLIDGEIDIRNVELGEGKTVLIHKPMLLLKNLKVLELCFELLLDQLRNYKEDIE